MFYASNVMFVKKHELNLFLNYQSEKNLLLKLMMKKLYAMI